MTPLLFEQSQARQVALEVTGTSGSTFEGIEPTKTPSSTFAKTTALAVLLLGLSQMGPAIAALLDRRYLAARTIGSEVEIRCLKVTQADLFSQINRIYEHLLNEQVDLDVDVRRIVYGSLWDLYS